MNKYLVSSLFILLLAVVHLFGRVQTLSEQTKNTQNQVLPAKIELTTNPTFIPTSKPRVVNKTQPPTPTRSPERKKVTVTITEVGLAGTYYCYENKANELVQKQVALNTLHKTAEFCADNARVKINECVNNNSSADCSSYGDECVEKFNTVMSAQDELRKLIKSYCP